MSYIKQRQQLKQNHRYDIRQTKSFQEKLLFNSVNYVQNQRRKFRSTTKSDIRIDRSSELNFSQLKRNKTFCNAFSTPRQLQQYTAKKIFKDKNNQEQLLFKEYLTHCEKQTKYKDDLYRHLRHKFIKLFPRMKKKYSPEMLQAKLADNKSSDQLINSNFNIPQQMLNKGSDRYKNKNQDTVNIQKSHKRALSYDIPKKSQKNLQNNQQLRISESSNKQNSVGNYGFFYSRSKRKCLNNAIQVEVQKQPVPVKVKQRMTYLKYMKSHRNFKKIAIKQHTDSGMQLLNSKQQIMKIQKQGTKSHRLLMQCYQQAIQKIFKNTSS